MRMLTRRADYFRDTAMRPLTVLESSPTPANNSIGKITANRMPVLRSSCAKPATHPTTPGPRAQPTSPARASSANIVVPPRGIVAAALLNVPGHIIPTDNPQNAQQTKDVDKRQG